MAVSEPPKQFDPRLPSDAVSQKINKLIYSGLLKKNDKLELVNDLAQTYSMTSPTTHVFKLKSNVRFHNGDTLSSKDVKLTYESMLSTKIQSPFKSSLAIINSIETPDDQTIIFNTRSAYAPFPTLMTLGILPARYLDHDGEPAETTFAFLAGTGPYALVKDQVTSSLVELARFDQYHDTAAKTAKIIFRVIQDSTLRALELIKGRVDLIQNDAPFVLIPYLSQHKELDVTAEVGINFGYMAFNFKTKPLQNLNVRKAIALAIDRNSIIKYKLSSMAEKATSLMSPQHWIHNPDLAAFDLDLAKAKALLDQSPYPDPDGDGPLPRFELTYKTSSVKERVEIAELIAENLGRIGIKVTVKSYEFGTFFQDIRQGQFDLFTLSWVGLSDQDIYYSVFHSSMFPPTGANRGFYSNSTLDQLLDASRMELNPEKQKQLYQDIQAIVYNDFAYVPLWYEKNFVIKRKNVQGYTLRSDASYMGLVGTYK